MYFCIALSASEMPIFVRFFLFFPATGRKYGILVMHKKQSVKNANDTLLYRPWQNKTN
jgi:hypothetical protein